MQLFVSKVRVCQKLQWALSLDFNFNLIRVQFLLHLLQELSPPYLLICCKDCKQKIECLQNILRRMHHCQHNIKIGFHHG